MSGHSSVTLSPQDTIQTQIEKLDSLKEGNFKVSINSHTQEITFTNVKSRSNRDLGATTDAIKSAFASLTSHNIPDSVKFSRANIVATFSKALQAVKSDESAANAKKLQHMLLDQLQHMLLDNKDDDLDDYIKFRMEKQAKFDELGLALFNKLRTQGNQNMTNSEKFHLGTFLIQRISDTATKLDEEFDSLVNESYNGDTPSKIFDLQLEMLSIVTDYTDINSEEDLYRASVVPEQLAQIASAGKEIMSSKNFDLLAQWGRYLAVLGQR